MSQWSLLKCVFCFPFVDAFWNPDPTPLIIYNEIIIFWWLLLGGGYIQSVFMYVHSMIWKPYETLRYSEYRGFRARIFFWRRRIQIWVVQGMGMLRWEVDDFENRMGRVDGISVLTKKQLIGRKTSKEKEGVLNRWHTKYHWNLRDPPFDFLSFWGLGLPWPWPFILAFWAFLSFHFGLLWPEKGLSYEGTRSRHWRALLTPDFLMKRQESWTGGRPLRRTFLWSDKRYTCQHALVRSNMHTSMLGHHMQGHRPALPQAAAQSLEYFLDWLLELLVLPSTNREMPMVLASWECRWASLPWRPRESGSHVWVMAKGKRILASGGTTIWEVWSNRGQSHKLALEKALRSNSEGAMICEDDLHINIDDVLQCNSALPIGWLGAKSLSCTQLISVRSSFVVRRARYAEQKLCALPMEGYKWQNQNIPMWSTFHPFVPFMAFSRNCRDSTLSLPFSCFRLHLNCVYCALFFHTFSSIYIPYYAILPLPILLLGCSCMGLAWALWGSNPPWAKDSWQTTRPKSAWTSVAWSLAWLAGTLELEA